MRRSLTQLLQLPKSGLTYYEKLWLLAPLAVWFSFQPFIRFGQDSTMYFEVSIVLLYLLALALIGLPSIFHGRRMLMKQPAVWLVSAYLGLVITSLAWTPNLTRGLLTVGVTGLLYMVFLAGIVRATQLRRILPALVRLYVVAAVVMSLVAVLQLAAGIWLEPSVTLLCAGCIAEQFGFARPNVFAIEPQFFGSLLLAPVLVLFYRLIAKSPRRFEIISFIIISMALFLTLSRGAIAAWAMGTLVLLFLHARRYRQWSKALGFIIGAFALSLVVQGSAAALNPTVNETFSGAITKVISQLSLGTIDITLDGGAPTEPGASAPAPNFDGYVEESTDVRVNRSTLALQTWTKSPESILFGVGVGGAGVAVHEAFPDQLGAREIVQNQYIETLLEQGVFGLLVFVAVLVMLVSELRRKKWLWAIVAAFLFQWLFFSGYPNALHVYLVLIVLYLTARRDPSPLATRY